jgi:hypothetical protein
VRIRIALTTAVAVMIVPFLVFTLISLTNTPAASARTRHTAAVRNQTPAPAIHVMSYANAEKVAVLATFYNGLVAKQQENEYLHALAQEKTFLLDLNARQQAAAERAIAAAAAAAAAQRAAAAAAAAPVPAAAAAAVASSDATSTNTPDWACIRWHESGNNYAEHGGGAYQFENGTWTGITGLPGPAQNYSPAVQDAAALKLYNERGWEPWTTRYVCGL